MPRNIRWDESVLGNTLSLVEALLLQADGEVKDEELKTVVDVEWVTENKLRVTGFKDEQINRKRKQKEVGTKKEHLLKLLKEAGKSLKLPFSKNEASASPQNRELDEIQIVLDCLKELEVREDEKSAKNQGYWKFRLMLKHQTATLEENLDVVRRKWRENSKTNSAEASQKDLEYEQLGTLSPPENLPRSGVACFVGREAELENLHQLLQQNDQVAIAAIAGMGGVGKTELALQYTKKHLTTYLGGVCWLQALQYVGLQVVQFARTQFNLNPPEDIDLLAQVQYCWRNWREGEVLLVLDNVTDYKEVKPYLPPSSSRFKVLMTTRQLPGVSIAKLSLDVLQPDTALELLRILIGTERINVEALYATSLCKRLGYLPLGIELVGRYLARKEDLSLEEMLQRLEAKGLKERSLSKAEDDMTAQQGVQAAFELSWLELSGTDKQLACLLSLFAFAPIPWFLVELCLPDVDAEELEESRDDKLLSLHLLQRKEKGIYQLHPLLREFFQVQLQNQDFLAIWGNLQYAFAKAMIAVAKKIPQTPTREQITVISPAIPHLAEVADNLIEFLKNEDLIWAFIGNAAFYNAQGLYDLAVSWLEQCLEVTKKRLGEEHPDVATSYNNLALLYYSQGRYSEAEPLYKKALELRQRLLGEEYPDVATSYNDLALLYCSQGRYSEAEPLYKKALELWQRLLGEEHPYVATSYNNLARLYESQGRYSEAEPLYKKALELKQRLLGEEYPDVATSYNNLAGLYESQGRYSEAEPLYKKALELKQRLLGEEYPDVATSYNDLALLYRSQGRYSEAEPLYKKALELWQRLLGEEHPDVATSYNNLAGLYEFQGRYSEAEPLYKKALEICQSLLGEEHPYVARTYNNLAGLYKSQGRYSEAEPLHKKALELKQRLWGEEHPDVATSYNNLALLYYSQGRYSEAEPLYKKALELRQRLLGEEHPDVATSYNNLALLYKSQGRYSEAEPLYKKALLLWQRLLGEEHPDVATSYNNLAGLYKSQGRYSDAEPLYKKALEIAELSLGVDHPNTATIRENLKLLRDKYT